MKPVVIQSRLPRRWSPNLFSYKSIIDLDIESLLSGADSCLYSTFSVDYSMVCVHSIYYLYRNSARKDLQLPKALDWLIPLSFAVAFLLYESHHLKSFSLKSHLFRLMKGLDMISVMILVLFFICVSLLISLVCSYAHKSIPVIVMNSTSSLRSRSASEAQTKLFVLFFCLISSHCIV